MHLNYKKAADDFLLSKSFNKNDLPDISGITIKGSDEKARMQDFLNHVKNPYLFKVGDIAVRVVFSGQSGDTLQSHIYNLLSAYL
jgi:hypothetical protein